MSGSIDTPFVVNLGSTKRCINHATFNDQECSRLSAEMTAISKATQNLVKSTNMFANQYITIGIDAMLVHHLKLERTNAPVRMGNLRIDSQLRYRSRPMAFIPWNAPTLCLSRTNGTAIRLDAELYLAFIQTSARDRPTLDGSFTEIYYRGHRGALLDFPSDFGEGRLAQAGRKVSKMDLSEFATNQVIGRSHQDRFGRSHTDLFQLLRNKLYGNLQSHIVNNFQDMLDLWVDDLLSTKLERLSSRRRSQIAVRIKTYLQPTFIKDGLGAHQLNVDHPAWRLDSDHLLSHGLRSYLCHLLQPMFELLYWSLASTVNRYNSIPAPPLGHLTTTQIRSRVSKFHSWHFILKGNEGLIVRMLPAMRFAQLSRYNFRGLDPDEEGNLSGPTFLPMNSGFRSEPLYMDFLAFVGSILPALHHPRNGIPAIPDAKLAINLGTDARPKIMVPTPKNIHEIKSPIARNRVRISLWFHYFAIAQRCAKFNAQDQTYRKYRHPFQLERLGISTIGKFRFLVTITLKKPSAAILRQRPHLAHMRFHPVSAIHEEIKNKLVPHPDSVYPGTDNTGSISHLSRAPIILDQHVLNRPVAGGDFGQKEHVAMVFAHQRTAHQQMETDIASTRQALANNLITPERCEDRCDRARATFAATRVKVRNAHTQHAILASRSKQQETAKRRNDRAYWLEQGSEHRSVDKRLDDMRARRHVFKGSSPQAMYQQNVRISRHHNPLTRFYKDGRWLDRSAYKNQTAAQSYFPRMAAFISKKTTAREFYFDRSPVIKGNREQRREDIVKRKRCTKRRRRQGWITNPPLIATGTDGTGNWAAGQPSARGLGMVKALGDIGCTMLMVAEPGTSSQDPIAQPNVDDALPPPSATQPGNPVSGLPDHQLRPAKALVHYCGDSDHSWKRLRFHTPAAGRPRHTSGKQRYCLDAVSKTVIGLTSTLHPQRSMHPTRRIQLSTYGTAAGFRNQIPDFEMATDANGENWTAAQRNTGEPKQFSVALHRDVASADLQRSLALVAALSRSRRPAYNDQSGFYVPPSQAAIDRWHQRAIGISKHSRIL